MTSPLSFKQFLSIVNEDVTADVAKLESDIATIDATISQRTGPLLVQRQRLQKLLMQKQQQKESEATKQQQQQNAQAKQQQAQQAKMAKQGGQQPAMQAPGSLPQGPNV